MPVKRADGTVADVPSGFGTPTNPGATGPTDSNLATGVWKVCRFRFAAGASAAEIQIGSATKTTGTLPSGVLLTTGFSFLSYFDGSLNVQTDFTFGLCFTAAQTAANQAQLLRDLNGLCGTS